MTLLTIVVRGLTRRPVRTSLTLLGISIGIAAVVALVGISRGFSKSWATGMKARGTDVVVSNMAGSLTPKPFDAAVLDRVAHVPGVVAMSPSFVDLTSVETAQMMMVSARQWGGFSWSNLKVVAGRLPHDASEKVVVLGSTAAEMLKKKVGDPIQLETGELKVVGIVDGNAWVENSAVILSLKVYQDLTGNDGKINVIDVRAKPPASDQEVRGPLPGDRQGSHRGTRDARRREHRQQPGFPHRAGDELGNFPAGGAGGCARGDEHHADDRL